MVEVGDKGVSVRLQGGGYIFQPNYSPEVGDKAGAIPLKTGETFIVGMTGNPGIAAGDKPAAVPSESGVMWAVKGGIPLPITITAGITSHYALEGTNESLGEFEFYWDGTGALYLSGSSSSVSNFSMDDGIAIVCSRGTSGWDQDPSYTGSLNITNWSDGGVNLFQRGTNTITVYLGNSYGTSRGCSAIYLIQTS